MTPFAASPFTPDTDGRMVGIRVINGAGAATTLTELQQFRLTCVLWTPNAIEVGGLGSGLHTAPAFPAPVIDFPISQPVKTDKKITIEGRNTTAETPITVETQIWGCFEG